MDARLTKIGDLRVTLSLGDRIRGKRAEQRLTQVDLARLTGLNPKTIIFIESGRSDPKTGTVSRIADVLGVSLDYLRRGE